jgi:hypothetical protein
VRLPVRSETDAFRIAYGYALVTGLSILVGYLLAPLWGIGLFLLAALAALLWDLGSDDPERRSELAVAAEATPPAPNRRRVLVVANEALGGSVLREEILGRREPRPELHVVAPVLPPRSHYAVSDIDEEREEARRRLDATLAWAAEQGYEADGQIGDLNDPLAAIGDELRLLGADEVVIATHPPERANWLESGIFEHLRKELDLPVTHVVIDREHDRVEIES